MHAPEHTAAKAMLQVTPQQQIMKLATTCDRCCHTVHLMGLSTACLGVQEH